MECRREGPLGRVWRDGESGKVRHMPGVEIAGLFDVVSQGESAPSCVFVLFGATGDLAALKITPALYNLAREKLLGERTVVLGVARGPRGDEQFRNEMLEAIRRHSRTQPIDEPLWNGFARRWHYHVAHSDNLEEYKTLAARIKELDSLHGAGGNRLFYLATAPEAFPDIIRNVGRVGLNRPERRDGFVRLVVEKPFGRGLATARDLNNELLDVFKECQLFRIDHYLGKETVQNLLVFRFANAIIEPLLNRQFVDRVEISTTETAGMAGRRGAYHDRTGALRDMVQNHMLQLLALTAMEAPWRMAGEAVRDEKVKVLRAIRPLTAEQAAAHTVRGQYGRGEGILAYRQENGVDAKSMTETYAAVRLYVDNWRWAGVPFYLRTGKRLARKASEIVIVFKREPTSLFDDMGCDARGPNRLVVRINPDEGINLVFDAKVPGVRMLLRPVKMDFRYNSSFASASPEAYEHLLLDAIQGEAGLFIRNDEVEAAWRFIDSVRGAWDVTGQPELVEYAPLTWGPPQARKLLGDPYGDWQTI